jgi:aminotransferase EvaB
MKGFLNLGYKKGDLPVTEKLANEIFSLPLYPSLSDNEHKTVVNTLIEILKTI